MLHSYKMLRFLPLTVTMRQVDIVYFFLQRLIRGDDDVVTRQKLGLEEAMCVNSSIHLIQQT